MKNKLLFLAILAVVLSFVLVFSSCGESTDTDESDTETKTETDTETGVETDTEQNVSSAPDIESDTNEATDTESEIGTDTESESETDNESGTESDTNTEVESDTNNDGESDTDSETDTETNTEAGVETDTETETEPDEPEHVHTEEIIPSVAPTCTETGLTEGKKCSVCEEILVEQETVPTKGHTEETIEGKDATCTETGLTEGEKCSECGEILVEQTVVDALGHTEETIEGKDATCTETGLTEGKKCSECGEILVEQEEVPASHKEEIIPAVAPTCTKSGLTEGKKCSVCEEILVEQMTVDAAGHTEEILPAVEPTCSEEGLTEGKKCSECGEILVIQETVGAKGHIEEILPAVAPTCTEEGLTEGKKCSECGEILVEQEEVPASHKEEIIPAVEPTCTEEGLTEGKKCSECGEILVEQETVPARHKFEKSYICSVCSYVSSIESTDLEFTLNTKTDTYTVSDIGACKDTDIVIPYTYESKAVTSIGDFAFYNCDSLTSVTIPSSVTSIGDRAFYYCTSLTSITVDENNTVYKSIDGNLYTKDEKTLIQYAIGKQDTSFKIPNSVTSIGDFAFYNCDSLTSVTIPSSVTSIGRGAFYGCDSLTSVNIPNSVTSIGTEAFYNCDSLTSITVDENNTVYKSIDGNLYTKDEKTLIQYAIGKQDTSFKIPNSVTIIGRNAFEYCTSLTSVTIGNRVTSIGSSAFSGCTSLTSVTIGNSVTSIGGGAFHGCTGLTSITIPNRVKSIGSGAFVDCTSLTSVTIGNSVTSIESSAFYSCSSLTSINIPESVTSIGRDAFRDCTGLTSITIPNRVKSIGNGAFWGCTGLTIYCEAVAMPSGWNADWNYSDCPVVWDCNNNDIASDGYIYTVIDGIRYGIKNNEATVARRPQNIVVANILSDVTYKGTVYPVTSIESSAFYGCTSLTSITIPNSVTSIGDFAFENCTSLTSITIPNRVKSIGSGAFDGCTYLTEINFNAKAMDDLSEDNYVFSYAGKNGEGITVTIGKEVTKIPAYLFYPYSSSSYSPKITSVEFEEGSVCKSIGSYAFRNCASLTSINIPSSVTSIGNSAFEYCTSLTSVTIGNRVTSIGSGAFSGCDSLTSVNIPNSVTSIGSGAFSGCDNLTSVTIGNSVTSIGNSAFSGCDSLTSVNIPNSVTSIGNGAFAYCSSLTSVEIPEGLTSIGYDAFDNCTSLTSITIPNSVTSIGGSAFRSCTSLEEINFNAIAIDDLSSSSSVFYNVGINGEGIKVTIGKEVTKIPAYLFHNANYITSVVFEEGSVCQSIGEYAFRNCTSLTSVNIPNSVTSIGNGAFYNCTSLISATIGKGVTSIGKYAFYDCTALTEINFNAIAMDDLSSYNNVFYNAGKNGDGIKVTIGKEVTKIPAYLFYSGSNSSYSPKITSVTFEEGSVCESIGEDAFRDCTALTEINFNAKAMDDLSSKNYVFYNAGKDGEGIKVTIGKEVTKIPAYLFCPYRSSYSYSPKITSVTFEEDSVCESIGEYAFYGCTSLTSITIPDSVTSIGSSVLGSCSSLESLTIPFVGGSATATSASSSTLFGYIFGTSYYTGGIPTKQYYDLSSYSNSSTYYIPSSLKNVTVTGGQILYGAFYDCSNLECITIGEGVTSIGYIAFYNCTSITYNEDDNAYYLGNNDNPYVVLMKAKDKSITSCTINENTKFVYQEAFSGCTSLTSITIPEKVTSIGGSAFYNCTSLTSVTIGESVTSIGSSAFYNCTSLTSVTIGESVTSIGNGAFFNCSGVTSVNYLGTIEGWCNIEFYGYDANPLNNGASLHLNGELLEELAIPNTVTEIKACTFSGCTNLTSITIPDSVTSIGNFAFENCTSLTSITIPDSVTSIGNSAFYYCRSLTRITIPSSVTSIGNRAFDYCTRLTSVNYLGTIEQWCNIEFGNSSANPLNKGESLYLNGGLLEELVIPDTITEIKTGAFAGGNFTKVTIPESVTSIGDDAFLYCYSLTSVNYLGTIEQWCNIEFGNCYANPLYYANDLYINGELLTELVIPNAITEIKTGAFAGGNFTSITIADSVTSIGNYAFTNCASLTSVTIPDSVTSIGNSAFFACRSLTSITIPSSVTSIGNRAFDGCTRLTSVNYLGTIEQWCNITFGSYSANPLNNGASLHLNGELLEELAIPNTVTEIKACTFSGCTSLTSITIPDSVTSIGDYAFYGCTSLTIYCEATSEPNGWNSDWNYSNRPVYWYSENEPTTSGNYWHYVEGKVDIWE